MRKHPCGSTRALSDDGARAAMIAVLLMSALHESFPPSAALKEVEERMEMTPEELKAAGEWLAHCAIGRLNGEVVGASLAASLGAEGSGEWSETISEALRRAMEAGAPFHDGPSKPADGFDARQN